MIHNLLRFVQSPAPCLGEGFRVKAIGACQSIGISGLISGACIFGITPVAVAQIIPDDTLGAEPSVIQNSIEVRGALADRIEGGALRDVNLFHSFLEFNVATDQRVYFANPVGVEHIFSRVTGSNPSEILGTLGVDGTASLFLINPNGILFGENAVLDIQGSFTGTTANAVQFGEQGSFSATNPEPPSALLTVDPSAYVFNQIGTGNIINRSVVFNNDAFGLRAGDGQTLTLLSPEIRFEGGQAYGFGGDIHIGGIAEQGIVTLDADDTLSFPRNTEGANITLTGSRIGSFDESNIYFYTDDLLIDSTNIFTQTGGNVNIQSKNLFISNDASIGTFAVDVDDGGDIFIFANFVDIAGDSLIISGNFPEVAGNVGSIFIETDQLELRENSDILSGTQSLSGSGDITIQASQSVRLSGGSSISASLLSGNVATDKTSGNITISTRFLDIQGFSFIENSTNSLGDAGSISLNIEEEFNLEQSFIYASTRSEGSAGNIQIETNRLRVLAGSVISAFTSGIEAEGDAGNIVVRAAESIEVSGFTTIETEEGSNLLTSTINSDSGIGSRGNAGDIIIETNRLDILDGATVSAVSILSEGNPGNIFIISNDIEISGWRATPAGSAISSVSVRVIESQSLNEQGNLFIDTQRLVLQDGGTIDANVFQGFGNGGKIDVNASESVLIDGVTGPFSNDGFLLSASITSRLGTDAQGSGGDISINTPQLSLNSGASVSASTFGIGNAGDILLQADRINLNGDGGDQVTSISSATLNQGDAGNIDIYADQIILKNGAGIDTSTDGQGDAGDLNVYANDIQLIGDSVEFFGFSAFTTAATDNAVGNGGSQYIQTDRLLLQDGAFITSFTAGNGNAGDIQIEASEIRLRGTGLVEGFGSAISSNATFGASGDGGDIAIRTDQLIVEDGGGILSGTLDDGDAGNLTIEARDIQLSGVDRNGLSVGLQATVSSDANGDGGDIHIDTGNLFVLDGMAITAATDGNGDAGNINISAVDVVLAGAARVDGLPSTISARTTEDAQGIVGDIKINTTNLSLLDGATISARTSNPFSGGNISIRADRLEAIDGGQITTSTGSSGNAGNITLNIADTARFAGQDATYDDRLQQFLNFEDNSQTDSFGNESPSSGLFANTRAGSTGDSGQIIVNAPMLILEDRAQISSQSLGSGIAGDIQLNSRDRISLTNSDIVTTAAQSSGGNIEVNTGEGSEQALLILNGDSDITTESFGDGGNITLGGLAVIAFDDSDIIARSQSARGGNITLSNFFSETVPPDNQEPFDGDGKVDVNADGQITAGIISFPDISFIENSLTDLPEIPVDTDSLIAGSCIARSQDDSGSFIITGAGGLPERPGSATISDYSTGEVRSIPTETAMAESTASWQLGEPIQEPQGVYQLADGRLVMSLECVN